MGKINPEWKRTLKFFVFSMSAAVVELSSFALCDTVFGMAPWVSQLISQILSVLWNFTINRRYTFQSAGNVPVAMLKVALFYVVFTPASTWATQQLTEVWLWNGYLVKGMVMATNLVLEFLYQRFFVFKDSLDTNDRARRSRNE
ncbi:MAG: GtrA family protein [Oscillospiraceae bacterium]|nr:GtrA family protein [Oscillospiraceae bacterium]